MFYKNKNKGIKIFWFIVFLFPIILFIFSLLFFHPAKAEEIERIIDLGATQVHDGNGISSVSLDVVNVPKNANIFCIATTRDTPSNNVSSPSLSIPESSEDFYLLGNEIYNYSQQAHFVLNNSNSSGNFSIVYSPGTSVYQIGLACFQLNFNISSPILDPDGFEIITTHDWVNQSDWYFNPTSVFDSQSKPEPSFFVINSFDAYNPSYSPRLEDDYNDIPLIKSVFGGSGPTGHNLSIFAGVVPQGQYYYFYHDLAYLNTTTFLSTRFNFSDIVPEPDLPIPEDFEDLDVKYSVRKVSTMEEIIPLTNSNELLIPNISTTTNDTLMFEFEFSDNYLDFEGGIFNLILRDYNDNYVRTYPVSNIINTSNFPIKTFPVFIDLVNGYSSDFPIDEEECNYFNFVIQYNNSVVNQRKIKVCLFSGDVPDSYSYHGNPLWTGGFFTKTEDVWRDKIIFSTFMTIKDNLFSLYQNTKSISSEKLVLPIHYMGNTTDILSIPDPDNIFSDFTKLVSKFAFLLTFLLYIIYRVKNSFGSNDV